MGLNLIAPYNGLSLRSLGIPIIILLGKAFLGEDSHDSAYQPIRCYGLFVSLGRFVKLRAPAIFT